MSNLYAFTWCREFVRATSKRPDVNRLPSSRDQYAQASNQVPSLVLSNEINPPEVFSNRDAISQSNLRRNKKQQTNKGRDSKRLNLTGNVDLGNNVFKQNKQLRRKNATRRLIKTTTQHPNTISEDFQPNPHRHNHYDNRQKQQQQQRTNRKPTTTSTQNPPTYPHESSTTLRAYIIPSTSTLAPNMNTSRIIEKVMKHLRFFSPIKLTMWKLFFILQKQRLENVRQKLLNLTDAEKLEYMKMKAERKAQKNKSINDTIP